MFCPICGKKMIEKKALNKPLYYCSACDFLTKGELVDSRLEKSRYDLHVCDNSYLEYMQKVYENFKKYIKGNIVLDYGCGKIHALDSFLKQDGYQSYYYDLYYFNKLKEIKYDTIIMVEVIEHILDLNSLFVKLNGLLSSRGRLIIMTNFKPSDFTNWWYLRDLTHVNFYSLHAFKSLAIKYNFRIVDSNLKNLIILEKKL